MHLNFHVSFVVAFSKNLYIFCLVQCINYVLLNLSVYFRIKSVNLYSFLKHLFKVVPKLRYWKSNNCKASFVSLNILLNHCLVFSNIFWLKFLLFFWKCICLFLIFRFKRCLSENLDYCRACHLSCQLFSAFISMSWNF